MKTTNKAVYKIAPPKVKVTTKGYINLIARNRAETTKRGVKIYRSKVLLNVAKFMLKSKDKANKLFSQSFVQVGIFEAKIKEAKQALKNAKRQILTSIEYFALHVNLSKAILHTKNFRYSLPSYIANLLF
jgi:KaiC/GvpD/RAD55 family RecA-like ATPase